MLEPFKIVWTGEQYRVSIANYEGGMVYKETDLLPLLREARAIAKGVTAQYGAEYCELAGAFSEYVKAKAFLDATAAIEEEKGVEG